MRRPHGPIRRINGSIAQKDPHPLLLGFTLITTTLNSTVSSHADEGTSSPILERLKGIRLNNSARPWQAVDSNGDVLRWSNSLLQGVSAAAETNTRNPKQSPFFCTYAQHVSSVKQLMLCIDDLHAGFDLVDQAQL